MMEKKSKESLVPKRTKRLLSVENVIYYRQSTKYTSEPKLTYNKNMHGAKKVLIFCIMTAILPSILIILPLYLRHTVFADVVYKIAESDIIEIRDGISSIFCEKHSLNMNSSFNAYQLNHRPEISNSLKHIRLKKSMLLPDDTMEYWGFYLLKGATVELRACSRYNGSRLLVVEGERDLKICELLDKSLNNKGYSQAQGSKGRVFVTFETAAEEIYSTSSLHGKSTPDKNDNSISMSTDNIEDDVESKLNNAAEDTSDDDELRHLKLVGENYIRKHKNQTENIIFKNSTKLSRLIKADNIDENNENKIRHQKHHKLSKTKLDNNNLTSSLNGRKKRNLVLDRKINHGGNTNKNITAQPDSDSVSSFENNLLTCYSGREILLPQKFYPHPECTDIKFLSDGRPHMVTTHEIHSDGYYYYIFYSDNDYIQNDIHAIFDIRKPTYKYSNISESKFCANSTSCSFPISFWSDETVIVEVPTRDGIESEADDYTYLVSTCHPRMAIYVIFPISVLFLILGCAFL